MENYCNENNHQYAEINCPHCHHSICSGCCRFDSRGDHAHDPNEPFMICQICGSIVPL